MLKEYCPFRVLYSTLQLKLHSVSFRRRLDRLPTKDQRSRVVGLLGGRNAREQLAAPEFDPFGHSAQHDSVHSANRLSLGRRRAATRAAAAAAAATDLAGASALRAQRLPERLGGDAALTFARVSLNETLLWCTIVYCLGFIGTSNGLNIEVTSI